MEDPIKRPEKIKLTEINPYLTCYLCKGYLIDATTISECLHSFCRSCIIKFLQDNSYCPICEVIINKAKPNLKLDKTLQDIVYKLVPELFLREMTRRKQYYLQYPQIAARVSPEERGEDTERTIFNPQDFISLSMEYVSADSSPGAIKILTSKNDSDKNDQLSLEENQALMKRYLQCPGMCRIDVLKKFVRNKYNVDTSLFHIDILYKRVPLPEHYTLIDIAYIYSWKRNEPMKFFFRITDINKLSERFDYFDSEKSSELIVQLPVRTPRNNGSSKRKEHVSNKKKNKQDLQNQANGCDKQKNEVIANEPNRSDNSPCDKLKVDEQKLNGNKENVKVKNAEISDKSPKRFILKIKKDPEKDKLKHTDNSSGFKVSVTSVEPEHKVQNKQNVYTNITLNRTNNMEIITKIQKVSNKGRPIELNILEQTVKGDELATNSENSLPMLKPDSDTKNTKNLTEDEEKIRFLETFELAAKNSIPKKVPQKSTTIDINKRKPISPLKSVSPKKSKVDKKPVTRIILQTKPKQNEKCQRPGLQTLIENCKIPSSLSITIKDGVENSKSTPLIPPVKNYIEILKLPEENSNDKCNGVNNNNKHNFSLRMNDDSEQKVDEDLAEIAKSLTEKIPMSTTVSQIVGPKPEFPIPVKTNVPSKFNVPPVLNVPKDTKLPRPLQSFQKIFEESIKKPESTSVENDVQKPVDSSNEVTSSTSNNKRNILEIASQLFKKTKLEVDKNQVNSTTTLTPKVAIPRLTSQRPLKDQHAKANLHSNALGLNYTISVGPDISSKTNGLNPNSKKEEIKMAEIKPASPKPTSLLTNISQNLGFNSPKNSPKHSPKSSPMIKHMYAAVPDTFSPKLPSPKMNNNSKRLSGTSSPQPISTASPPQIQVPSKTNPKAGSSKQASPLSPNQILEIYNIQNLAQLSASLNFNGLSSGNQLAAYQHAMFLKHFEMQNRQNWLNMNQGSLLQYEKYLQNLQNLKSAQNQLLSNIKEN